MTDPTDNTLEQELAQAVAERDRVTEHHRVAARAVFAWRTIDEELMALTHDSLELADAAVRAAVPVRTVGFEGDGLSLEVEVDGDRVFGQVLPPDADSVAVESIDGATDAADLDASGVFSLTVPTGLVRFVVTTGDTVRRTPWLELREDPQGSSG